MISASACGAALHRFHVERSNWIPRRQRAVNNATANWLGKANWRRAGRTVSDTGGKKRAEARLSITWQEGGRAVPTCIALDGTTQYANSEGREWPRPERSYKDAAAKHVGLGSPSDPRPSNTMQSGFRLDKVVGASVAEEHCKEPVCVQLVLALSVLVYL